MMKDKTLKLYRVNLAGIHLSKVGSTYVVATNPDEAYRCVRKELDARKYGFDKERELQSIELIAEAYKYTNTPAELFFSE